MSNKPKDNQHILGIRHSLAHLLAATIVEMYPGAKNAIGPAIENGFYQDFETPEPISEEDFPKIEKRMREKLKSWGAFERKEVGVDEARKQFAWNPYKLELIDEFAEGGKQLTFYISGDFIDLCRGGHVDDAHEINPSAFKLTKASGAYWRGDQNKQQLQRIYGVAFETPDELAKYLEMLEQAKERDHRKLGQELDLFTFSDLVGSGLPLYTPRGTIVREGLIRLSEELREKIGFQKVWSPHITKKELYEISGHWAKFGPELFLVKSQETSDQLVMKPMNCPHHNQIYASRPRSYRELPIKYMETATAYRDEKSGELHGLSRVRSLTQDDSHAYCREVDVAETVSSLIVGIQDFYRAIEMDLEVRLSFRDESDGYLGSQKLWDFAQDKIEELAKENSLKYYKEEGEAAFYGPKIDFMAIDAIGRKWQVATVQFDFVQPERFKLEYVDEDGSTKQPIMIHCAIMGSFDRFFSVYIEHTAGKFPVWLAPEQVRLVTTNQEESTVQFAESIRQKGRELGLRVVVDNDNESVGKKIRTAQIAKVPYTVVIGPKEVEGGQVVPRIRSDMAVNEQTEARTIDEFLKTVVHENASRTIKTSL